jgi:hypothetical protein
LSRPNILIVSEVPLGASNGFGVTLQNLFGDWPPANIRFFFTRGEYLGLPLRGLDFRFAPVPASPGRRFAIPKLLGLVPEWRGDYSRAWLKRNLRGFLPDLVFSSVHSIHTIRFADWISREIGVPHALHVMDEPFHGCEKGEIEGHLGRVCSLMTISKTMRVTYLERYGVDSVVFHNGAEQPFFDIKPRVVHAGEPIRLRFVGNLLQLQHFNAIEDVAGAIFQFNKKSPRPAILEFFGNESPAGCSQSIQKEGEVVFHGPIPLENRLETLAGADILVIPFTFDPWYFESYRLSIPTKLPENLATGIPVLLYGPKGMAATDLCLENDLATVITERSIPGLVGVLEQFTSDPTPFMAKASAAQDFTFEHLSSLETSRRFHEHLLNCCRTAA